MYAHKILFTRFNLDEALPITVNVLIHMNVKKIDFKFVIFEKGL